MPYKIASQGAIRKLSEILLRVSMEIVGITVVIQGKKNARL